MTNLLITYEPMVRGGAFLGIFALMAAWEVWAPCRPLVASKALRWRNNLALVVLNSLLLRALFPTAAIGMAAFAARHGWGVLHYLDAPVWLATLLALIALDLAIWLQHVMLHAIPLLWRLHRVHHADLDYDLTTGARFHPLEIVLSMLIRCAAIVVIGPSVVAVIVFEVLLNATAMFNHGNVSLPPRFERWVRWLVVTPDMHRVHHSVDDDETNSNFGFNLPWWDRLFGTYRAAPRGGQQGMTIGIHGFSSPSEVICLPGILTLPFRSQHGGYVINRRAWSAPERPDH